MPNHVVNEVIWSALTAEQQSTILSGVLNADGKVDFELLVPIPLNVWLGNVGRAEARLGFNALDWCRQHWGTKWNAYSQRPAEVGEDAIRLVFETAWSPPYGWLVALLNRFQLPFDHNWHDEGDEIGRVGRFEPFSTREHGPLWRESPATGAMQRHLHKLQWGVETSAELESAP